MPGETRSQGTGVQATQTSDVVLRLVGLSKDFGSVRAVDGLQLELRRGEVLGFLGPNGAGKSTTVGMILGLIAPTAGRVEYAAISPRRIGAVVEEPAFYPYLSGRENLRALALGFGGMPSDRIDAILETAGLGDGADRRYKTYSTGMKQRLGIASTLLCDPQLIILDEPTNGLDPAGQRQIRDLIPRLASDGRSVIMASHLLHEVEQVCDRVVIVRHGRLIREGTVADLLGREHVLDIEVAEPERAAAIVAALDFVERADLREGGLSVVMESDHGAAIGRALGDAGLYPTAMVPRRRALEDVFLELTGAETPAATTEAKRR